MCFFFSVHSTFLTNTGQQGQWLEGYEFNSGFLSSQLSRVHSVICFFTYNFLSFFTVCVSGLKYLFLFLLCYVLLCLPPTGSGDILFFPVRLSVCLSVCLSVTNRVRSIT